MKNSALVFENVNRIRSNCDRQKPIMGLTARYMRALLMLNTGEISETDVTEAQAFVEQFLPTASEDNLKVNDYRTAWVDSHIIEKPKEDETRVVLIHNIVARAKAKQ